MIKKLGILRHAKSAWDADISQDAERHLNDTGVSQAVKLSEQFSQFDFIPQLVIVSGAKRTKQTWKFVERNNILKNTKVTYEDGLYLASLEDILRIISSTSNDINNLMIVGHNPGMSDLAQLLGDANVPMSTCAFVGYSFTSNDWVLKQKKNAKLIFSFTH